MVITTSVRIAGLSLALAAVAAQPPASPPAAGPLWSDVTADTIADTAQWTNKVEIADVNGDGRPGLLFANGGNYSEPEPRNKTWPSSTMDRVVVSTIARRRFSGQPPTWPG